MSDTNAFDRVSPSAGEQSAWQASWETEDNYWHENFTSRPYVLGPDYYERYRPGYRYGFESAQHHMGREWDDAEPDLQRGWEAYEHRGQTTWEEIKHAVRDAWDRVVAGRKTEPRGSDAQIRE